MGVVWCDVVVADGTLTLCVESECRSEPASGERACNTHTAAATVLTHTQTWDATMNYFNVTLKRDDSVDVQIHVISTTDGNSCRQHALTAEFVVHPRLSCVRALW